MKIAIVRGPSLNKFEMQYYEPLVKKFEIVCFTSQKPIHETKTINLPVVKLPCWGQIMEGIPGGIKTIFRLFGDPQVLVGLEDKLSGFDIVHTAELFSYYTHQALMAKEKGKVKKVVATVSENIPFNQEWYPKQKDLKKFALKNLDYILAISQLAKDAMIKEGFPEEKIEVVSHGLDCDKFKQGEKDEILLEKLGIKETDFVILSVGRLVREKGFYDLFYAVKKLKLDRRVKEKENIKCLIVGKGPEKEELKIIQDRLGLKNEVTFAGDFPYEDMPKVYNLADIFVLASIPTPTWQEQFGMVLIEAMACGIPVVATKTGAIPEVVGKEGLLAPPNNWRELTNVIRTLILDKRHRQILAERERERVLKEFERKIVAKKIERVYQEVLRN